MDGRGAYLFAKAPIGTDPRFAAAAAVQLTQRAWSARPGCVRSVSVTARFRTFGLLGPQDQTLTHSTLTLRPDPGTRCHGHRRCHGTWARSRSQRPRRHASGLTPARRAAARVSPFAYSLADTWTCSHTHTTETYIHIQVAGPVAPFTFTTHLGRLRWPLATQPRGIGRAVLTVDTYIHMAAIRRGDQSPSAPSTRPGPSSPFPAQPPSRCVPPQGPRS